MGRSTRKLSLIWTTLSHALSTDVGGVTMKLYVDGVDLGYDYFFEIANRSSILGSWSRTGGKERMTALHFNKTREAVGAQSNMLTGKVEVKIYALGEMVIKEMYDYVSTSLTADSMGGGKKCIKTTTNGSNSFDSTPEGQTASSKEVSYKLGEHLQTITLNYCSAFGLIYHKILPPPPDSDSDEESVPVKKERPTKRKRSTATSVSTATRVSPEGKTTLQNNNVQMVTVQKTYAVVDLTEDE
eukprot:scaffold26719_cov138-Skeletonema_menzelii.AAC.2